MTTNVSVGLSTIVGYVAAAAAAVAPIVGQLADDLEPLGVPSSVWVLVSAGLAAITTLGRMWQAAEAAAKPEPTQVGNVEIDGLPVNAHEGAEV